MTINSNCLDRITMYVCYILISFVAFYNSLYKLKFHILPLLYTLDNSYTIVYAAIRGTVSGI